MSQEMIDRLIRQALEEDLGDGDHSSLSTIPKDAKGKARLLVKEDGVLAGVDIAQRVFKHVSEEIRTEVFIQDGQKIKPGDVVFHVEGPVIALLSSERLVLNFMQRMSGIATATRLIVDKLEGLHTRILDTRKTTPNMRIFEKYAVRAGGGENHRMGLYDMVMIKDNHVDFAGGITPAIDACHRYLDRLGKELAIELEVRNFRELKEALDRGGIQRIMLDNFSPADLARAINMIDGRFETEASGGITIDTIREYAETGVDYISVGALTHHISSLDLSLKAIN